VLDQVSSSLPYIQQFLPLTSTSTTIIFSSTSWIIPNVTNVSITQTIGNVSVIVTLDGYGTVYVSAYQRQLNYTYQVKELANCSGLLTNILNYTCTFVV
jgi:hypothetical protein